MWCSKWQTCRYVLWKLLIIILIHALMFDFYSLCHRSNRQRAHEGTWSSKQWQHRARVWSISSSLPMLRQTPASMEFVFNIIIVLNPCIHTELCFGGCRSVKSGEGIRDKSSLPTGLSGEQFRAQAQIIRDIHLCERVPPVFFISLGFAFIKPTNITQQRLVQRLKMKRKIWKDHFDQCAYSIYFGIDKLQLKVQGPNL